ncbi:hypothetical protein RCL_jg6693.t1 [Rhizophagus clarus]|uniref:Uncharacterized protein n=1 Tax=Rhizophagus clarus TaxID=94130 RepID=A0A8H3LH15_9GLOM|nr:hypothetical protein RCL_jg6693.t1 [Rhizophagus clarus]
MVVTKAPWKQLHHNNQQHPVIDIEGLSHRYMIRAVFKGAKWGEYVSKFSRNTQLNSRRRHEALGNRDVTNVNENYWADRTNDPIETSFLDDR